MKEEIIIEENEEKPETITQNSKTEIRENQTKEKQPSENSAPVRRKTKTNDYMTKLVFVQALMCLLILLCVFLAKSADSTMIENLKKDFENFNSYDMTKQDFVDVFSNIKDFFSVETETSSASDETTNETYIIEDTTLGIGGDDLTIYEAIEGASFAPFYTTQQILNPIEEPVYSSYFGYRDNPFTGEFSFHSGLDIAAQTGTNIRAAFSGTVIAVSEDETSGLYVKLEHENGLVTFYCHCSEILVEVGANILQGETIAKVGETGAATGPHLHFEIRINNVKMDPMWLLA